MLESLKKLLISKYAQSVARKLLTLLSGFLLAQGVQQATVDQFTSSALEIILALLPYLIAQIWSLLEKRIKV